MPDENFRRGYRDADGAFRNHFAVGLEKMGQDQADDEARRRQLAASGQKDYVELPPGALEAMGKGLLFLLVVASPLVFWGLLLGEYGLGVAICSVATGIAFSITARILFKKIQYLVPVSGSFSFKYSWAVSAIALMGFFHQMFGWFYEIEGWSFNWLIGAALPLVIFWLLHALAMRGHRRWRASAVLTASTALLVPLLGGTLFLLMAGALRLLVLIQPQ